MTKLIMQELSIDSKFYVSYGSGMSSMSSMSNSGVNFVRRKKCH